LQTSMQRSKRIGPIKSKALEQSPSEERMTVRLTAALNDTLRRAALYRGDISKTISDALENVNLVQVKAIDLEATGELAKSTTIVIDSKLFGRLKEASKQRGSSMNLLINSALAHKFGHPPKEKSKP
jgi:BRCT domain type II-containing protein